MPTRDPAKKLEIDRRYKAMNREQINVRRRTAYHADPDAGRERQRQYRQNNPEKVLAANRKHSLIGRARSRAEMIAAYGGKCACCGEAEPQFLQLDHIHNDGHVDRKVHKTSDKLIRALRRLGWPRDRYQLLCANCNFGKRMNGGVCPHVR